MRGSKLPDRQVPVRQSAIQPVQRGLALGDGLKGGDVDAQELITISNILSVNAFGGCRCWIPSPGAGGEMVIVGIRGDAKRYLRPEYAEREAEKIVDEQTRSAKACGSEDLPQLEWRKQVDKALEDIEFTRQCHNDRFFRDEKQLQDHDYRIKAWGESVSDALRKIVAQDERIAKLEAKLDEFENVATVDEVVGRVAAIEKRVARIGWKVNELTDESALVMPLKD
jgi:hypothetical protein